MWVQWAAVVVAGVLWGAAALRARHRPEPAPGDRPEPRHLPAALVDLVLHDGQVTSSAVDAGLRDLERDGWIGSVTHEDGTVSVYPRAPDADVALRPYQGLLLERVRRRRGDLLSVPVAAVGPGDGADHHDWWLRYTRELERAAVAADLLRPVRRADRWLLRIAQLAVAASVLWAVSASSRYLAVSAFATTGSWLALASASERICAPRLGPRGEEAAAWWRAAGTQPDAPAVELAPDQVWSGSGGRWRVVQVGDPVGPVGGSPLALLAALGAATAAEALVLLLNPWTSPWAEVPAFAALGFLAVWVPRFVRRMRLPAHATLAGEVVRRWSLQRDDSTTVHRCIAVDDGIAAAAVSFEIGLESWQRLRVGTRVRVEYNARTGRVRGLWHVS